MDFFSIPLQVERYSGSMIDFGNNLMRLTELSGNVAYSPISLWFALAMAASGSKGTTLLQFLHVLRVDSIDQLENIAISSIKRLSSNGTLNIANGLAIPPNFQTEPEYVKKVQSTFSGQLFHSTETYSVDYINNWASNVTRGKIVQLLDPRTALDGTILINAMSLEAKWVIPFNPVLTHKTPFYKTKTSIDNCLMMQNIAHYSYFENEIMQSIRLEYARGTSNVGLSAIVILPREHQLLTQVIDETLKLGFKSIVNTLYTGESVSRVKLSLPKFTVSFTKELNSILFQMGLNNAFIGAGNDKADFSGISNGTYIEKILQRVYMKIDEDGTEAAAISAVVLKRSLPEPVPDPELKLLVNRPFLFYIVDDETKQSLFVAYIESIPQ